MLFIQFYFYKTLLQDNKNLRPKSLMSTENGSVKIPDNPLPHFPMSSHMQFAVLQTCPRCRKPHAPYVHKFFLHVCVQDFQCEFCQIKTRWAGFLTPGVPSAKNKTKHYSKKIVGQRMWLQCVPPKLELVWPEPLSECWPDSVHADLHLHSSGRPQDPR